MSDTPRPGEAPPSFPPPAEPAAAPDPWADFGGIPPLPDRCRVAARHLREFARLLPLWAETTHDAFRRSVDGPYPADRALASVIEWSRGAHHWLRHGDEVPPPMPTAVPTVADFENAVIALEGHALAAADRFDPSPVTAPPPAIKQPVPSPPVPPQPLSLGEFACRLAQLECDEQFKGPYGRRTDGQPSDAHEEAYDRRQWLFSVAECRHEIEATPGYQQFRTACLRRYGEELSAPLCRRIVVDVLRSRPGLTAEQVEAFTLSEATVFLEAHTTTRVQQPGALPPVQPDAEPVPDPDARYTVADARDLLRFRRENAAKLQAFWDNPTLLLNYEFRAIMPAVERVRLEAQFRPPEPPLMPEEAAGASAVFPMLVDAARQESDSPLDAVALDAMVSRVAIRSGQLLADVWKLTLTAFRRLKWPDLDAGRRERGGREHQDGNWRWYARQAARKGETRFPATSSSSVRAGGGRR